ncbi:hypothetical protein [Actinorugispora endophytica]|uniref:Low temperature requirement A protein (LtrA) n=1 Tax=Actinorugispora endophytica TaxID=1605990 RepID=A0A4R6V3F5_9ACTN|nr:hypothetical protein [Actinorugispora endophytica]TDQ54734.1 hypothetical protein EV190_10150 [Actinorugispora endophytica]
MRSGRHGAARPPIGVLIHRDRVDFSLYALQAVIAVVVMIVTGPTSPAFWLGFLLLIAGAVLCFRRIERLSREELAGEELL